MSSAKKLEEHSLLSPDGHGVTMSYNAEEMCDSDQIAPPKTIAASYGSIKGSARIISVRPDASMEERTAAIVGSKAAAPPPGFSLSWRSLIVVVFVLFVGTIGTLQSAVNNRAGVHYGTFLIGTWISFFGGWCLLLLGVLIEMRVNNYPFLRFTKWPSIPQVLPGAMGFVYVSATVGLTTLTGFAVFFVSAIVGQLLVSSVLDQFGWLGSLKVPINIQKGVALLIAIAGALLSSVEKITDSSDQHSTGTVVGAAVASVAAGLLLPVQTALNRSCSELLPSKLQTTLFSFTIGLAAVTIAVAIAMAADNSLATELSERASTSVWWMYVGGPGGVLYIASGIWFVRVIGSAAFFVTLVCGQLAGSATIDGTGFLGTDAYPTSALRIIGIVMVVFAAAMMQFTLPFCKAFWTKSVCPSARVYSYIPLGMEKENASSEKMKLLGNK